MAPRDQTYPPASWFPTHRDAPWYASGEMVGVEATVDEEVSQKYEDAVHGRFAFHLKPKDNGGRGLWRFVFRGRDQYQDWTAHDILAKTDNARVKDLMKDFMAMYETEQTTSTKESDPLNAVATSSPEPPAESMRRTRSAAAEETKTTSKSSTESNSTKPRGELHALKNYLLDPETDVSSKRRTMTATTTTKTSSNSTKKTSTPKRKSTAIETDRAPKKKAKPSSGSLSTLKTSTKLKGQQSSVSGSHGLMSTRTQRRTTPTSTMKGSKNTKTTSTPKSKSPPLKAMKASKSQSSSAKSKARNAFQPVSAFEQRPPKRAALSSAQLKINKLASARNS